MGEYLTRSKRDILRMLDQGLTSKEMAVRRNTSVRTIETQRHKINKQFGVHSSDEALLIAKKKLLL